jgi:hypothetical protein
MSAAHTEFEEGEDQSQGSCKEAQTDTQIVALSDNCLAYNAKQAKLLKALPLSRWAAHTSSRLHG